MTIEVKSKIDGKILPINRVTSITLCNKQYIIHYLGNFNFNIEAHEVKTLTFAQREYEILIIKD